LVSFLEENHFLKKTKYITDKDSTVVSEESQNYLNIAIYARVKFFFLFIVKEADK
jgi:hypothetical protein